MIAVFLSLKTKNWNFVCVDSLVRFDMKHDLINILHFTGKTIKGDLDSFI